MGCHGRTPAHDKSERLRDSRNAAQTVSTFGGNKPVDRPKANVRIGVRRAKAALSSGANPTGNRSSRKQSEQS